MTVMFYDLYGGKIITIVRNLENIGWLSICSERYGVLAVLATS